MKEYIKLAWRNIWRNKRRTLITAASVFFAIFFALIMRALQLGSYSNMIDNAVTLYSGHLQIHDRGYWDNKSINRTLVITDELMQTLRSEEQVKQVVPGSNRLPWGRPGLKRKE